MAPERPLSKTVTSPAANHSKPPGPATRIVPVIPFKLTKNVHEKPQQTAGVASGLVTPEQSEILETIPQSTTIQESSVPTPPSAPVTPESSLIAEQSAHAGVYADSPLPEANESVSSIEPALVSNEPVSTAKEMSAPVIKQPPPRESDNGAQKAYQNMQFGDIGPYHAYGPPFQFQGSMNFGPSLPQNAQVPLVGDVINGLERTSLNERNTTAGYYPPPDSTSGNGPFMMPPNMLNSAFGYASPPGMYGMPPMHWGYDGSMVIPPYFGSSQYGAIENGDAVSRNLSQQSSNKEFSYSSVQGRDIAKRFQQKDGVRFQVDPYVLQEHIRKSFRHPDYADYTIIFDGEFGGNDSTYLHSLIAIQSPYLARIIGEDRTQMHPTNIIKVSLVHKFLMPYSMTMAIGYLYGNSLPQTLVTPNPTIPSSETMYSALQYAAAGQLLEVPDLVRYGYHQAVINLTLESIETLLSFLKIIANDASGQLQASSLAMTIKNYLVEPMLDCLIQNLPSDFALDASQSELTDAPRLPFIHTNRPRGSIANAAALAAIRFGELPHDRNVASSNLLSRILLSMDTDLVQELFKHTGLGARLGWDNVNALIKELIAEREERRIKARRHVNNARTGKEWTVNQLEAIRWQELIVPDEAQPGGFTIQKKHIRPEDLEPTPFRRQ